MPVCAARPADGTTRDRVITGYRLLSRLLLVFGLAGALEALLKYLCWRELPFSLPPVISVCFLLGGWWFHSKAARRGPKIPNLPWQLALSDILAGSLLIGALVALGSAHRTQVEEAPVEAALAGLPEADAITYSSNIPLEQDEPAYLVLVMLMGLGFTLTMRHQRVTKLTGTGLLVSAWALLLRILGLTSLVIALLLVMESDVESREYLLNALISFRGGCCGGWELAEFVSILHMGMICFPLGLFFSHLAKAVDRHSRPALDAPDWRLVEHIAVWLWCISIFAATYLAWSWAGVPEYLSKPYEGRFRDVLAALTGVVLLTGLVCLSRRPGPMRKSILGLTSMGFLSILLVWISRGYPRSATALAPSLLIVWLVFLFVRGITLPSGIRLSERALALGEVLLRYGIVSTALLTVPLYLLGLVLFFQQSIPDEMIRRCNESSMGFGTWALFLEHRAWLTHHGLVVLATGGVLLIACRSMLRAERA